MKTKSRNADISLGPLADDISQLVHATTELSADKVQEARERLSSAVANGKAACDRISAKVVDGTKAADRYVRHNRLSCYCRLCWHRTLAGPCVSPPGLKLFRAVGRGAKNGLVRSAFALEKSPPPFILLVQCDLMLPVN